MIVRIACFHQRGPSYHAGSRKQNRLFACRTRVTDLSWTVSASATFLDVELLATSFDTAHDELGWIVGEKFEGLGDGLEVDDLVVHTADTRVSQSTNAESDYLWYARG